MRNAWGAALVMIATLLTGCSVSRTGPAPSTTTITTTTAAVVAARPKPVDMRAVDPCALLRDLRPTDFGIDLDGTGTGGDSPLFPGSKNCYAFGLRANLGLGVTPAVNEGFDGYVDGVLAQVARSRVHGYRFATVRPANPQSCFGAVDVNDGQLLYLSLTAGAEPARPQDAMCGLLPQIADAALVVLAG